MRNGIPTPPQGYHLVGSEAEKQRLKKPLPDPFIQHQNAFQFRIADEAAERVREAAQSAAVDALQQRATLPTRKQREIRAVMQQVRGLLSRGKTNDRGMIPYPRNCPVRVSPACLRRALDALQALFELTVACGASIPVLNVEEAYRPLRFGFEGFTFSVGIEERSRRVEIPPEKRRKRFGGYLFPGDAWKLEPTAELTLTLSGPGYGNRSLRDGRRKIEERLEELIEWMFATARASAEDARLKEERRQKTLGYLAERDRERQEVEFQKRRKRQLLLEARGWRHAEALRAYIAAVEAAGYNGSSGSFSTEQLWREWLSWARAYADAQDPIVNGKAGATPPYPEPKEIENIPWVFLDYDDPEQAMRALQQRGW